MRGLWALLLPVFALGFGLAWWLKPDPPVVEAEAPRPKVVPRVPGEDSGLREYVITADTTLDALGDVRTQSEDFAKALDAIDPKEIPGLLDSLANRAGYFGLGYDDKDVLQKLVEHWYDLEPEAALLWTLGQANSADRQRLLSQVIAHEAGRDLDRAIEMVRQYGADEEARVQVPSSLADEAAKFGAEKLLEVCLLGASKSSNASGVRPEYPEGFDFRKALDGLAEIEETLPKGERMTRVPSNLLSEWAKLDPQAAYDWVAGERELTFNGFDDFIDGYATIASDQEIGVFTAGVSESAAAEDRYEIVWEVLKEVPKAGVLMSYLESASGGPEAREQHLIGVLRESSNTYGGGREARAHLLEMMDPAARMRALAASGLKDHQLIDLVPDLRRLGHSEEEIAAMMGGE